MAGEGPADLEGVFTLFAMVHTLGFEGAHGPEEAVPWDGSPAAAGPYTYASRPCSGHAPVNNLSTDLPALGGAVPSGRVPVSTRTHPLRFTVREDEAGLHLEGSITLTVCQLQSGSTPDPDPVADVDKPRIDVTWTATVDARSPELVSWSGTFSLVGGTGIYAQLRGDGHIAGYFFCFDPEGCASVGALSDSQYAMIGRYRLPASAVPAAQP